MRRAWGAVVLVLLLAGDLAAGPPRDRREGNTESHASSSRSAENPFIPTTAKKELSGGHEHCFEGLGCSNPGV